MSYRLPRKKNVSPEKLDAAALEVSNQLRKDGIASALVGGLALQAYGSSRHTGDVDLIVSRTPAYRPVGRLTFGGIIVKASNGIVVDLIDRRDGYRRLYVQALKHSETTPFGVRIVTPPYLMAMKLAAGRSHDEDDLKRLVVLRPRDVPKAATLIERLLGYFARDEFEQLVRIARSEQRDPRRRRHL